MSGVYLTLIQGVNDSEQDLEKIMTKSIDLRGRLVILRKSGFFLAGNIALMDKGGSGNKYEKATVAYKFYSSNKIPNDQTIEMDLEALLRAYDGYVAWNAPNPPRRTLLDSIEPLSRSITSLETEQFAPEYTVDQFISDTNYEKDDVNNWQRMLIRKKQLIFQGPPGTGKTFIAEKLAKLVISNSDGFTETIQFHPDFSYQDFIQGYFPEPNTDGALTFNSRRGLFLEFCEKAKTRKSNCVLVIDEINRANLSHVFGELMYLLEYRERQIPLACTGDLFQIPKNVLIIGTMNTADRSIALVDHALRRRFSFFTLGPKYEILTKFLKSKELPADSLVNTLKEINRTISNWHYEIGISFFMHDDKLLKNNLELIWKSEIEPYLDEFFYDQRDEVESFRWEKLSKSKLADWV
jgi:5-methylcytosine-specific restriction protein B